MTSSRGNPPSNYTSSMGAGTVGNNIQNPSSLLASNSANDSQLSEAQIIERERRKLKQEFDKVVSEAAEGVKSRDEAIKKREELLKKRDALIKEQKREKERLKKLLKDNETTRDGIQAASEQLKS